MIAGYILGKRYEVLLQKPPELADGLYFVQNISTSLYDIGSKLHVSLGVLEGLNKDMSLSEKAKLEQFLNKCIKSETVAVTWNSILKVLSEQGRIDNYHERSNEYSRNSGSLQ